MFAFVRRLVCCVLFFYICLFVFVFCWRVFGCFIVFVFVLPFFLFFVAHPGLIGKTIRSQQLDIDQPCRNHWMWWMCCRYWGHTLLKISALDKNKCKKSCSLKLHGWCKMQYKWPIVTMLWYCIVNANIFLIAPCRKYDLKQCFLFLLSQTIYHQKYRGPTITVSTPQ